MLGAGRNTILASSSKHRLLNSQTLPLSYQHINLRKRKGDRGDVSLTLAPYH